MSSNPLELDSSCGAGCVTIAIDLGASVGLFSDAAAVCTVEETVSLLTETSEAGETLEEEEEEGETLVDASGDDDKATGIAGCGISLVTYVTIAAFFFAASSAFHGGSFSPEFS